MSERFFDSKANRDKLDAWLTREPNLEPGYEDDESVDEPDCGCEEPEPEMVRVVVRSGDGSPVSEGFDYLDEWPALRTTNDDGSSLTVLTFTYADGSRMEVSRDDPTEPRFTALS